MLGGYTVLMANATFFWYSILHFGIILCGIDVLVMLLLQYLLEFNVDCATIGTIIVALIAFCPILLMLCFNITFAQIHYGYVIAKFLLSFMMVFSLLYF
jgi:hypothetical protein